MGISQYILVFLITTFAGSYAIIFGGGSFLVLTTLFLLGVDPKVAVATSECGTLGQMLTGSLVFIKNKKINRGIIMLAAPAFLAGALIGAFVLMQIDGALIKKMVSSAIIIFAILTLFKNPEEIPIDQVGKKKKFLGLIFTALIGVYAMVITVSSGTVLMFVLMYLFGLRFKSTIENRQFIMVTGVLLASMILMIKGLVDIYLVIPIFLGRALGSYVGAKIVLRAPNNYLRVVFSIVIILLALKTLLF